MTGHERIAVRNIKKAFNYEIGGIYNSYLDGEEITYTLEEAKDMVYDCAVNNLYGPGIDFCIKYIEKLFDEDPDVAEIPWAIR